MTGYEIRWREEITAVPGLPQERGDFVEQWVGSDDPEQLREFAVSQGWDEDQVLCVTRIDDSGGVPERREVHCLLAQLITWEPTSQMLPDGILGYEPPRSSSLRRLDLLRAIRRAVDKGVGEEVIARRDASGILLLVAQAVERHEKARR